MNTETERKDIRTRGSFKMQGVLNIENGISLKERIYSGKFYSYDKEIIYRYSIFKKDDFGTWEFGLYEFDFPIWTNYMFSKIKSFKKTGWHFAKTIHLLSFAKMFKTFDFDKDILSLGERKKKNSLHKTVIFGKEEGRRVLKIAETEKIKVGKYYFLLIRKIPKV